METRLKKQNQLFHTIKRRQGEQFKCGGARLFQRELSLLVVNASGALPISLCSALVEYFLYKYRNLSLTPEGPSDAAAQNFNNGAVTDLEQREECVESASVVMAAACAAATVKAVGTME